MADERTRNLERAAAQGDVEAEAKLLLERVRAGDLAPEMLRFATYLGHPAAVVALGDDAPTPHRNLNRLRKRVALHGRPVIMRTTCAIGLLCGNLSDYSAGTRNAANLRRALAASQPLLDSEVPVAEAHESWSNLIPASFAIRPGTTRLEDILSRTVDLAARRLSKVVVLDAIHAAVIPWCLGTGDPARDRVEAHLREAAE